MIPSRARDDGEVVPCLDGAGVRHRIEEAAVVHAVYVRHQLQRLGCCARGLATHCCLLPLLVFKVT